MNLINNKNYRMKIKLLAPSLATLALATIPAQAVTFVLPTSAATLFGGNLTTPFYEYNPDSGESGLASSSYSTIITGSAQSGFSVAISFGGNPQPVLTSAFLKASNNYLYWDSQDLKAFNSGTWTAIELQNIGTGGITNKKGKFQGTSHAGITGTLGTTTTTEVPDTGSSALLLSLGVLGLAAMQKKKAR